MVGTVAHKGLAFLYMFCHTVIDLGLMSILISVWNMEDYTSGIKLLTSILVGGLSVVRWILFFRDRKRELKKNGEKSKDT